MTDPQTTAMRKAPDLQEANTIAESLLFSEDYDAQEDDLLKLAWAVEWLMEKLTETQLAEVLFKGVVGGTTDPTLLTTAEEVARGFVGGDGKLTDKGKRFLAEVDKAP